MRTIVIMGAASRDFNVVFRDDPDIRGAAFTAAQIPGIENRVYAIAAGCFCAVLLWLEKRRSTLDPLR
jgi:predicted GTPase